MSVEEKKLIIYISLFGVGLMVLSGVLFFTFYKVKKKMFIEKYNAEHKHLEELNTIAVEIQNQTLKNIGRELHDNLGQKLTIANLQLGMMKVGSELKSEQQKLLYDTLQESIKDLRSLSKSLNPDVVEDNGLLYCIKHEISRLIRLNYIKVELQVLGEPYRLNKERELVLFRIFQEAINNTLKHAQASSIYIKLEYDIHKFKMQLMDDGMGFDLESINSSVGLKNMQSRAEFIQADLRIKSDDFNGTSLFIGLTV